MILNKIRRFEKSAGNGQLFFFINKFVRIVKGADNGLLFSIVLNKIARFLRDTGN